MADLARVPDRPEMAPGTNYLEKESPRPGGDVQFVAVLAVADRLHGSLASLDADVRIALLHYSPIEDTLRGERLEIYPFLGSYLLAEAVDRAGADLIVHGHAHGGVEKGVTPVESMSGTLPSR